MKTQEQFEIDAVSVHGNKYSYTKDTYRGSTVKLRIVCPEHGEFMQSPNSHLSGHGCPKCGPIKTGKKIRSKALLRRPKLQQPEDYKLIPLSPSGVSLVSNGDYPMLAKINWRTDGRYAYTSGSVSMHRLLMAPDKGKFVDHINSNGLDNRRTNLRVCTPSENLAAARVKQNTTSKYKGVSLNNRGTWSANLYFKRKCFFLGRFKNEEDAARAYDKKAKEVYGEFARINIK